MAPDCGKIGVMAKKKQAKKHKFKYAGEVQTADVVSSTVVGGIKKAEPAAAPWRAQSAALRTAAVSGGRDFSYVGQDARRIAVLAGSLVALEVVLWYLLAHTGVGNAVYTFVKV